MILVYIMGYKIVLVLFQISIVSYFSGTVFGHINNQLFETSQASNDTLKDQIHLFLKMNHAQNVFDAEPNAPIPKLLRKTAGALENVTIVKSWITDSLINIPVANGPSQLKSFGPSNIASFNVIPSVISEQYIYNVSKFQEYFFVYTYNSSELEDYALRVTLTCDAAEFYMPVMAVARQERGATEWQLPLLPPPNTQQQKDYKTISQTLCPVKSFNYLSHSTLNSHITVSNQPTIPKQISVSLTPIQTLSIDVSSQSEIPLLFNLITEYVLNFDLKMDNMTSVVVSPSTPVFLQFNFPDGVDTVLVHATSNHTFCAIVAVQNKTCPVHDLESTVKFSNLYQTMSKQAALTLTKEQFPGGFYVTILTLNNDLECAGNFMSIDPDRNKLVQLLITEKISKEDFRFGIAVGLLFCTVIYAAVIVKFCLDTRSDARTLNRLGPTPRSSPSLPRRRRLRQRRSISSTTNLVAAESASDGVAADRTTLGFSSHFSYGAEGDPGPFSPHLVTSSTAEGSLQTLAIAPEVIGGCISAGAGGGPCTVVQQGASGSGGGSSSIIPTVLLSEEGMFDDCAELSRELTESLSAMREERPTLASETVEYDIVHESDSSLNDDGDSYSIDDLDGDSAEGGFETSGGDSRSRYAGDGQSNFSDSYYAARGNNLETGRPARVSGGEIFSIVQNSGIDARVGGVQQSTGSRERWHGPGEGDAEAQVDGRYGASPVLGTDKPGRPRGNRSREYINGRCSCGGEGRGRRGLPECLTPLRSRSRPQLALGRLGIYKYRTQKTVFVRDLTHKRARVLRRRSDRYYTTLISAFVFYFVPVLQLVSTYQKVFYVTGDQDKCYYNFLCANPYGLLSDFNHVFSNVGYVALGLLFIAITFWRQRRYDKEVEREPHVKQLGIPRDFGLYYAMALALMMVGMLSASYHVCPNKSNFQFDTAFMYVIAILLMLKLYQQRHPDITASADSVFIALALSILFGVIGGLFGDTWFWVVSSIAHVFICFMMSAYVYYLGRWSLVKSMRGLYRNGGINFLASFVYQQFQSCRQWRTLKSHFGTRVALLVIANLSNWAMMLFGLIVRPRDYDTYLLGVFLLNLVLYVMFYLIMKKLYSEHLGVELIMTLLLVVLAWVSAVTVFFQRSTDWSDSPAQSRNLNQPCVILEFFDWHDIWHFLSSLALFSSYYLIMIIDDDLNYTPRDMIAVF